MCIRDRQTPCPRNTTRVRRFPPRNSAVVTLTLPTLFFQLITSRHYTFYLSYLVSDRTLEYFFNMCHLCEVAKIRCTTSIKFQKTKFLLVMVTFHHIKQDPTATSTRMVEVEGFLCIWFYTIIILHCVGTVIIILTFVAAVLNISTSGSSSVSNI